VHYVFLSHDVDWSLQGPGRDHILARRDRFDQETIRNIDIQNPYNSINDYIAIEEKFGARSTFFFRTNYENGKLVDYEQDIQTLLRGGWEIGLHCDQASVDNFDSMYRLAGFIYDSSVVESKNRISNNTRGYFLLKNVIEFPITIMDAYMFTYMHISEDKIINTFMYALDCSRKYNKIFNIITMVWHANVLKMKGGRKYKDILEYLSCQEDVKLVNGIELAKIVNINSRKVAGANPLSLKA
jgi:hypothetical protein